MAESLEFNHFLMHLRPLSWPLVALQALVGFVLAGGNSVSPEILLGFFVIVVCMNGGTLAFNSYFDRDQGSIGWLDNPPQATKRTYYLSTALMLFGVLAALLVSREFFLLASASFVVSVAYSHPWFRLKSVPLVDAVCSAVGYGVLMFLGGWVLASPSLTAKAGAICVGMFLAFIAGVPLTQIYQMREDKKRGDRTTALALGQNKSKWMFYFFGTLSVAVLLFAVMNEFLGKLALLAVVPLLWLAVQVRNIELFKHKRKVYEAYAVVIVVDVIIILSELVPL